MFHPVEQPVHQLLWFTESSMQARMQNFVLNDISTLVNDDRMTLKLQGVVAKNNSRMFLFACKY